MQTDVSTYEHSVRAVGLVVTLLLVGHVAPAEAQLFGNRTLSSPLSRRTKPGETVGGLSGSERFLRGNRRATDFVGSDSRDPRSFVGEQQGTTAGRVRSATEGLRARRDQTRQLNPRYRKRATRDMYDPRLVVGFELTVRPREAARSSALRSFRTDAANGRFGSIEISVNGRTATLAGSVASANDRSLAEALVLLEPGIGDVQNDLVVTALPTPPPPLPSQSLPASPDTEAPGPN